MSDEMKHRFSLPADSFFSRHGQHFSTQTVKKSTLLPFKEHAQFPALVDILSRKHNHHAILHVDFSRKMHVYFIEALLHHLTHEHVPPHLRNVELLYLNVENIPIAKTRHLAVERDFQHLREQLESAGKYLLIVLTHTAFVSQKNRKDEDGFLREQFKTLLTHPACRFLILSNEKKYKARSYLDDQFDFLSIVKPQEWDVLTVLKQQGTELENFHHVIIPEELLTYAYSLAERYLSTHHTLEKTLLLLDSSAARTRVNERHDANPTLKPVMTHTTLIHVLSGLTQIPPSHLQLNKFQHHEFIANMQQRIFGQETALTLLSRELQQSQAHLQQNNGPFCSLLFVGPEHAGKKTTACALADQLFKQQNTLYFTQPITSPIQSIADIKLQQCEDRHSLTLKKIIRETPYAIIMFTNIEQLAPALLEGLYEILSTGYLHDHKGNQYNFRQAIVLMSTTLGAERLIEFTNASLIEPEEHDLDLMQLVMNELKQVKQPLDRSLPKEFVEEIMPELLTRLPASLCKHLPIVPFLPLSNEAIENIIRLKLKALEKTLDDRYGIELGYAPEIIRYLSHEVLIKQKTDRQTTDIDKALKSLYFTVEQAILNQADNKNRPNQLFLQLNETGQILRCDWLMSSTLRHHATSSVIN